MQEIFSGSVRVYKATTNHYGSPTDMPLITRPPLRRLRRSSVFRLLTFFAARPRNDNDPIVKQRFIVLVAA